MRVFGKCTIPAGITSIGYAAFDRCPALQTVTIAEGSLLEEINVEAFADTPSLRTINIPAGVTNIGVRAFKMSGIQLIQIPAGVWYVGEEAFYGCYEATIFCEAASQPEGWHVDWNIEGGRVVWGVDNVVREYTFVTEDGSAVTPYTGVYIPASPISYREGYYLEDWYTDPSYTGSPVLFPYFSTIHLTLYAKWTAGTEGLEYILVEGGEAYAVSGIGAASEESRIFVPYTYMGLPVIGIEYGAFSGCTNLVEIMLPEGLIYIDEAAFLYCVNLKRVMLPSGLRRIGYQAFYSCFNLEEVILPEGLEEIGDFAFGACFGLVQIEIPASVTLLDGAPFAECTALTYIGVAAGNTAYQSIDGVLFDITGTVLMQYPAGRREATYTIPESVTEIGNYAFYCSKLYIIYIPAGVERIGERAFGSCFDLGYVEFDSDSRLISIGAYAFASSAIYQIIIPEGVPSIGEGAFEGCPSLMYVWISASVTSIGAAAFRSCHALGDVTFAEDSILKTIGNDAFAGCISLTYITLPSGLETIGYSAFSGCIELVSVDIAPDGALSEVYGSAFSDCALLETVVLPQSLTLLGEYLFEGCASLFSLTVYAPIPPTYLFNALEPGHMDFVIYVPEEYLEDYRTSWVAYHTIIEAIP